MNKRAEFGSDLEQSAFWMPFTANRQFKKAPRLLARAEGMYYWTPDGRQVLDGTAGLWCVNAGHCRLKIALAYHRARGEGQRFRLIGRERGYHGVNFGGMAVGGLKANKKTFGPGVAGVDHIRHTHDLERNAFSRGQPERGLEFADELERLCTLHDPSTIAAVIC